MVLQLQGLYAQSDAVFGEALAVSLEHGSNTSSQTCQLRHGIGQNLRLEHRYAEAIEQLRALTRDECMPSESDIDIWRPQVLADLSQAQLDNGDAAAAYATATQALEYGHKALRDSYLLAIPLFAMARAALALERASEAEPLLRQALALRGAVHPANDPRLVEVKVSLFNALKAQKKDDETRALSDEIEPLLSASTTPYAADLRARLNSL